MFSAKFSVLLLISASLTNYLLNLPQVSHFFQENFNLKIKTTKQLFTTEELSIYNGETNKNLYLSILGNIFDVTTGAQFYGKGETYHIFVGRDNSNSFVTGNLEDKDISDKVIGSTHAEFRSLNHWVKFYKEKYNQVGKLIGRYYGDNGKPTPYAREVKLLIKEAELAQLGADTEKIKFPPCNIEWEPQIGTRVWCTKRSGGIERDWVGVPRQLYEVGASTWRCACIHKGNEYLGNLKEYEGCESQSDSCFVSAE